MTEAESRRVPIPPWRTWLAVGLGTLLQAISFGAILAGALASASDEELAAGPAFALGFGLVPIVFLVVAYMSGTPRASTAILKAMGLWLVIALPVSLFHPVTGLCAGFSAAAAVTLRQTDNHRRWARAIAAAVNTVYVTVLLALPAAGIFAGAVTPLLAMKLADAYSERKARTAPAEDQ